MKGLDLNFQDFIRCRMCRMLMVRSEDAFSPAMHLKGFSHISKSSKEYQGHGWGYASFDDRWKVYRTLKPVWKDGIEFPKTRMFLAHARSAYQDKDISTRNNMPYEKDGLAFAFNGELRGVRLNISGRIGAEKIFNLILQMNRGDVESAISKSIGVLKKRTRYIRALNLIVCSKRVAYVYSEFNEDDDYFTMYYKKGKHLCISSDPYGDMDAWKRIENRTLSVF